MKRALLYAVVFGPGLLLLAAGVPSDYSGANGSALLAKADFENGRADGWRPRDPTFWRVAEAEGKAADGQPIGLEPKAFMRRE